MNKLQTDYLVRVIERLNEVWDRAKNRCFRYSETSTARNIDIAFVEHLGVALYQLEKFQRDQQNEHSDKENLLASLKDAILQIHELGTFVGHNLNHLEDFQKKIIEKEDRWVRMLNISLTAFFMNICTENIRCALEEIDRNLLKASQTPFSSDAPLRKKPVLRIVK
ncbi:MAG: hypothetical protein H6855_00875 [Rhodospirillales bacterium]|nr:hypothetical protein [Rhodospirillales bacterium]MCB9964622.1 hypothetical protein [Rhodospirillales bacterium]MCB9979912.1 hypothetical protein [Rhodospirillales bacterium]